MVLRTFTQLRFRLSQPHQPLPPKSLSLQHRGRPVLWRRFNSQWQMRRNVHWQLNPRKSQAQSSQRRSTSERFWVWEWVDRQVRRRRPSNQTHPNRPRQRSQRNRNKSLLVDRLRQLRPEFSQVPAVAVR